MKKPAENTIEGFAALIKQEMADRNLPTIKDAATLLHTSPTTLGEICNGQLGAPTTDTPHARKKFNAGRIQSITRICDGFGFDLDACLTACGLPKDDRVIAGVRAESRTESSERRVGIEELELLGKAVELFGPLRVEDIGSVLKLFKEGRYE